MMPDWFDGLSDDYFASLPVEAAYTVCIGRISRAHHGEQEPRSTQTSTGVVLWKEVKAYLSLYSNMLESEALYVSKSAK